MLKTQNKLEVTHMTCTLSIDITRELTPIKVGTEYFPSQASHSPYQNRTSLPLRRGDEKEHIMGQWEKEVRPLERQELRKPPKHHL